MRSIPTVRACIAAALLASTLIPTGPAAATAEDGKPTDLVTALTDFPDFAAIPDSAALDLATVLHGRVQQITGEIMPGAQILLSAWPSNETIRSMPDGESISLTPIARAAVDETGGYLLRAAVTPALRALAGPDGIDVELDVFHADHHYTYLSQATPTDDGQWTRTLTGLTAAVPEVVDKAANLLDLTLDRTKAETQQLLSAPRIPGSLRAYDHPTPLSCTRLQKVGTKPTYETVATTYARGGTKVIDPNGTKAAVTADVTYQHGARTESSTGGSIGGGVFTINGSRSRSEDFEPTWESVRAAPGQVTNMEYQLEFLHAVFRRACSRDYQGNEDVSYFTEPLGSTGGGNPPTPGRYPLWKCGKAASARAGYTKVSTTNKEAATYSAAFNFAPIQGGSFSGSALSGYSDAVVITYHFDDPKTGWWCGDTGYPLAPHQRVQGIQL